MLEDFKNTGGGAHHSGRQDGRALGHMVPEGGYDMVPQYVFDGALLAGEAAGLCMNMGYRCAAWTSPWRAVAWPPRRPSRPSTREM